MLHLWELAFDSCLSSPRLQAEVNNGVYENTENVYEDIGVSGNKKKGKADGGKKCKGPPKSKNSFS